MSSPPLGDLLDLEVETVSPALTSRSFTTEPTGKPHAIIGHLTNWGKRVAGAFRKRRWWSESTGQNPHVHHWFIQYFMAQEVEMFNIPHGQLLLTEGLCPPPKVHMFKSYHQSDVREWGLWEVIK